MLYIIWIEGKMNDIGVEVNGTELENLQNVDVHYWKYIVNASILDETMFWLVAFTNNFFCCFHVVKLLLINYNFYDSLTNLF